MGWPLCLHVVTDSRGVPVLMANTLLPRTTIPHSAERGPCWDQCPFLESRRIPVFQRGASYPGAVLPPELLLFFPTESSGVNVPCPKTLQWHDESGTPAGLWGEPLRTFWNSLSSGQQEPRLWDACPLKPCACLLCLLHSPSAPLCRGLEDTPVYNIQW